MKWVEDNLAAPRLIPPHAYELKGDTKTHVENAPRVSRVAHEKGLPGLFNGVFFFIPLNILIDLMQRCGCVRDMADMTYRGKSMRIMEVVDRLTAKSDLNTVTVDWVLNCIGSWKLL